MDEIDDTDERAAELSTLAAIYPELKIDEKNPYAAFLEIPVHPSKPLLIKFEPKLSMTDYEKIVSTTKPQTLEYLPSLLLQVTLPEGYPLQKPAAIVLSSEFSWVPAATLKDIESQAEQLWEDLGRDQILFSYVDQLQAQAEACFGLPESNDPLFLSDELQAPMKDYENRAKRLQFNSEHFDCGVCLEPKKGVNCHRMNACGHVFCVACLKDFYTAAIDEGDVFNVKCLSPGCGKEKKLSRLKQTLKPAELLDIPLDETLVQRYVSMKRKKILEADKTVVYCPRSWCQGPAVSAKTAAADRLTADGDDVASDDESGTVQETTTVDGRPVRLSICEDCGYAFCRVCTRSWHGDHIRCVRPQKQEELTEEEKATMSYLRQFTSACPTCQAVTQKSLGCNHMICFQCGTHFCYLCSAWLPPEQPYKHFNTKNDPCYLRLFELANGDGDDDAARNREPDWLAIAAADAQREAAAAERAEQEATAQANAARQGAAVRGRGGHRGRGNARNGVLRADRPNQHIHPPAAPPAAPNPEPIAEPVIRLHRRVPAGDDIDQGLQRFLRLAANDEEDDWDSDELEDMDDIGQPHVPIGVRQR